MEIYKYIDGWKQILESAGGEESEDVKKDDVIEEDDYRNDDGTVNWQKHIDDCYTAMKRDAKTLSEATEDIDTFTKNLEEKFEGFKCKVEDIPVKGVEGMTVKRVTCEHEDGRKVYWSPGGREKYYYDFVEFSKGFKLTYDAAKFLQYSYFNESFEDDKVREAYENAVRGKIISKTNASSFCAALGNHGTAINHYRGYMESAKKAAERNAARDARIKKTFKDGKITGLWDENGEGGPKDSTAFAKLVIKALGDEGEKNAFTDFYAKYVPDEDVEVEGEQIDVDDWDMYRINYQDTISEDDFWDALYDAAADNEKILDGMDVGEFNSLIDDMAAKIADEAYENYDVTNGVMTWKGHYHTGGYYPDH